MSHCAWPLPFIQVVYSRHIASIKMVQSNVQQTKASNNESKYMEERGIKA